MMIRKLTRFIWTHVPRAVPTARTPIRFLSLQRACWFGVRPTDEDIEDEVSLRHEKEVGSFENFPISPESQKTLQKLGVEHLFPIQAQTFNVIHDGVDVIGKDKTGSGKTIAFLLPILERMRKNKSFDNQTSKSPLILIVTPTRELAMQVAEEAFKLQNQPREIGIVACFGGMPKQEQVSRLKRNVNLVVGTPGRLKDLIECGELSLQNVEVMVLDEMDQMLDMGFMGDIEILLNFIQNAKKVLNKSLSDLQFLMFSATVPADVRSLASQFLKPSCVFINLAGDSDQRIPKGIKHYRWHLPNQNAQFNAAIDIVRKSLGAGKTILVFTRTRQATNDLHSKLQESVRCGKLSRDVEQKQRMFWLSEFKKKHLRCLVATSVAARGLDIPNIDIVLQLGLTENAKEFVHRCGRTGRAGKEGVSVILTTRNDEGVLSEIMMSNEVKFESFVDSEFWKDLQSAEGVEVQEKRSFFDDGSSRENIKPGQLFYFRRDAPPRTKFPQDFKPSVDESSSSQKQAMDSPILVVIQNKQQEPVTIDTINSFQQNISPEFGHALKEARIQPDHLSFRIKIDESRFDSFRAAVEEVFGEEFEVSILEENKPKKKRAANNEETQKPKKILRGARIYIKNKEFPILITDFLDTLREQELAPVSMSRISRNLGDEVSQCWSLVFETPDQAKVVTELLEQIRAEKGQFLFKVE